jgi:FdhD protein
MSAPEYGADERVRTFVVAHVDGRDPAATGARDERVAHEEPLEIQVNGASVAVLMRTPGDDLDLVRGFLVTEGVVASLAEVASVRHCTTAPDPESEDNVVQVRLRADVAFDLERFRRHTYASSSCGVCGKATIDNACRTAPPLDASAGPRVSARVLADLPAKLRAVQPTFDATGGVHGAALFDAGGALTIAREDVGRHNAVDKAIGALVTPHANGPRVNDAAGFCVLLVSGRVSFEIVQKAVAARIPVVAGISAPTSLAVRMAESLGVTLVGFLRGDAMNVYTHAARIGEHTEARRADHTG